MNNSKLKTNDRVSSTPLACRTAMILAALVMASIHALGASGQYALDWFTIDGGGGTSTGGVYAVTGTIGQPDAGTLSGRPYTVAGGFWALPVAIQTTNAPTLTIILAWPGYATVSWEPDAPGFVLQERASPSSGTWTNAPSGATNPVVVPATLPTRFYRLHKP